jgi:glycosyltransferase involved in cell wall biosynthesis
MLLANEFVHDTRVYKEARSLIEWGCDVTVVAVSRTDLPVSETVDGIEVHRVRARWREVVLIAAAVASWWCRPMMRRLVTPEEKGPKVASARPQRHFRLRAGWLRRPLLLSARVARRIAERSRGLMGRYYPVSLRLLAFNHRMARRALALQPDVIQAHDLNTLLGAAIVKRLLGVPLVYDSHELYLERNRGRKRAGLDRLVWGPVQSFGIRRCDAVLSVAESICLHLERQYKIAKPHLIRNVQPYEPPASRSRLLSEELGIAFDRPVVIYPGAITVNRGLEVMIDSAEHLDDAAYVIMGYARNAAYLKGLRERAEERGVLGTRLFFREAVPIDDVVRYTASADLGIVPTRNVCLSYYYESSNKIFHCVMAGVPLVMSDHAEKRMLVERYGIGVLFDETDPRDIARAVNETLAGTADYQKMCGACHAAARELNWEHEEQKLRDIFAGLLEGAAPPVSEEPVPVIEVAGVRPAAPSSL